MKKSVYSLVLMDDVIRAVDKEAYRLGTSRSNLINQILAEKLSCVTPEMRMKEIFDAAMELLSESLSIQQQSSAALLTARTALEYKYRPTISYKIELDRVPEEYLGRLKVQIRTQSPVLSELFRRFFGYRGKMEAEVLSRYGCDRYICRIDDCSFTRGLINSGTLDESKTGEAMGEYVRALNRAVKLFFAAPDRAAEDFRLLEEEYEALVKRYII